MFALLAPASAAAADSTRIIVKREPGLSGAEQRDIRSDAGVRLVDRLPLPRTEVVSAPDASRALRALNADPDVAYAEVDHVRRALSADTYYSYQWALPMSDFDTAWTEQDATGTAYSGSGQTVAVLDSGIYAAHEDLQGQVIATRNFVGSDPSDVADHDAHGTAVSGTIAATRGNGRGIAGAAPEAGIMALRVMDATGAATDSRIAAAIDYLRGFPDVRIVNLSFGAAAPSKTVRAAIHAQQDKLFVAAAGNTGANDDTSPVYPCNTPEPNVICAGASTSSDARASYSNYGDRAVDLFAPGDGILAPVPPGIYTDSTLLYRVFYGTSFAAPYVSGAAALVLQATTRPLSAVELKQLLMVSVHTGDAFTHSVTGGRLDADDAVRMARDQISSADDDGDGWANEADACASTPVIGSPDGCPLDSDWDGRLDSADNCPDVANPTQADLDRDHVGDACDPDRDGDARPNGTDNCPSTKNPTQADEDRDGLGDACDGDRDGDGKANGVDACPDVTARTATGCPLRASAPPPDSDHDGLRDSADSCRTEPATTANGCPLPYVTAFSAKVRRHAATIGVRTSRAATVRITVQRKRGQRWRTVTRRVLATSRNRAALQLKRLRKGRYRAVVVVSSAAGSAAATTKRFRVR